jgi:hypothetical protein
MASTGGSSLKQSFSLPGESQKAAKILKSFLGLSLVPFCFHLLIYVSSRPHSPPICSQLHSESCASPSQRYITLFLHPESS